MVLKEITSRLKGRMNVYECRHNKMCVIGLDIVGNAHATVVKVPVHVSAELSSSSMYWSTMLRILDVRILADINNSCRRTAGMCRSKFAGIPRLLFSLTLEDHRGESDNPTDGVNIFAQVYESYRFSEPLWGLMRLTASSEQTRSAAQI